MQVVQVRHQLQPEGHLVGTIIVTDTWLQANMQVLLVFRVELGPDDFLKAVWLCVDKLGILGNGQVRIPDEE